MVQKILKYGIEPLSLETILMPEGAKILSAKEQNETIVLYAMVDMDTEKKPVDVIAVGTGHTLSSDIGDFTFVDTVKMYDGQFMFHVFYKVQP